MNKLPEKFDHFLSKSVAEKTRPNRRILSKSQKISMLLPNGKLPSPKKRIMTRVFFGLIHFLASTNPKFREIMFDTNIFNTNFCCIF